MTPTRYLLAKYIPDLQRMEPRNIGVIVWSPEIVEARFFAEIETRPGEVDGRTMSSLVPDPGAGRAYRQWIKYWRTAVGRHEIDPVEGGDPVPRDSENFLEALKQTGRGNFILMDGGLLWNPASVEELPEVADYLFNALVELKPPEEPRDLGLDERVDDIISATPLRTDPFFKRGLEVTCTVKPGAVENFEFSYAYQNGALQRLYQRVPFPRQRRTLKKTVDATAWMFDRVVSTGIIKPEQGAVFVYVTDDQRADQEVERSLRVLGSVSRVFNVGEREPLLQELRQLPLLATH